MQDQNSTPLFNEEAAKQALMRREESSVARAVQEIQAALVIGQRNPRNEIAAEAAIMRACQRKSLAEISEYEYSRGGTRITGPTVDLLRAIANRWGNLLYGWDEVSREGGHSRIRCWAWDTQSNARAERTFIIRHWRDTREGGYEITEERDIYENNANQAARRVRACLEEIIDGDIIDKAVDACRDTMKRGEKVPLKDRAVVLLNTFIGEFGVTKEMIEARLGNSLEAISENQIASLRRVYKSLRDGVGKREDYFKLEVSKPAFTGPDPGTVPTQAPAPQTPAAPAVQSPTTAKTPEVQNPEEEIPNFENLSKTPPSSPTNAVQTPDQPKNPLRLIRDLCKVNKPIIREGVLLGYLAEIGATDGSVATLEELQMTHPAVVDTVIKTWPDISSRITAALKAK